MSELWNSYGEWDQIAKLEAVGQVKAKITGSKRLWRPNFASAALQYVFDYVNQEQRSRSTTPTALDFGCGLGRNGPMLRRFFPRLVGVDIPEMIERIKKESPEVASNLYDHLYSSALEASKSETLGLVYDSVVLQHLINASHISDLIDTLSLNDTMRTIVSIYNSTATYLHLKILNEKNWKIWFTEIDVLSFEGAPHNITIFRRW